MFTYRFPLCVRYKLVRYNRCVFSQVHKSDGKKPPSNANDNPFTEGAWNEFMTSVRKAAGQLNIKSSENVSANNNATTPQKAKTVEGNPKKNVHHPKPFHARNMQHNKGRSVTVATPPLPIQQGTTKKAQQQRNAKINKLLYNTFNKGPGLIKETEKQASTANSELRKLITAGDLDGALHLYRELDLWVFWKLDTYYRLAVACARTGRTKEAISVIDEAVVNHVTPSDELSDTELQIYEEHVLHNKQLLKALKLPEKKTEKKVIRKEKDALKSIPLAVELSVSETVEDLLKKTEKHVMSVHKIITPPIIMEILNNSDSTKTGFTILMDLCLKHVVPVVAQYYKILLAKCSSPSDLDYIKKIHVGLSQNSIMVDLESIHLLIKAYRIVGEEKLAQKLEERIATQEQQQVAEAASTQ